MSYKHLKISWIYYRKNHIGVSLKLKTVISLYIGIPENMKEDEENKEKIHFALTTDTASNYYFKLVDLAEKNTWNFLFSKNYKERKLVSILLHHFAITQKMSWGPQESQRSRGHLTKRFSKYICKSILFIINPNIIKECPFVLDTNLQYLEENVVKASLSRLPENIKKPEDYNDVQNKLTFLLYLGW